MLDRPHCEEEIEISAIPGTSAGAMNVVALKAGLIRGGREGARENLVWFWSRVAAVTDARWSDCISALARATEGSPAFRAVEAATKLLSSYAYGPMLRNPLERIFE